MKNRKIHRPSKKRKKDKNIESENVSYEAGRFGKLFITVFLNVEYTLFL